MYLVIEASFDISVESIRATLLSKGSSYTEKSILRSCRLMQLTVGPERYGKILGQNRGQRFACL